MLQTETNFTWYSGYSATQFRTPFAPGFTLSITIK